MSVSLDDRNTAVPGTRSADCAADLMNNSTGIAPSWRRWRTRRRPVAQVVSKVKVIAATSSGNQPPSGILVTLEAK